MKKKLLIIHPALAPYRIDQFNFLSIHFDLKIIFLFENVSNQNFDQEELLRGLNCEYMYLINGFDIKGKAIRFGIFKEIKFFQPDIVVGYEYSLITGYILFLKLFGLVRRSTIGTMTDDSLDICYHVQTKSRLLFRKLFVQKLDFIVVLSDLVAAFYNEKFSDDTPVLVKFPLFQNPSRMRNKPEILEKIAQSYQVKYQLDKKKVLLFVGRLAPEKGLLQFLDIISPFLEKEEDIIFVIIGDGFEKQNIEELIKDRKISDKVLLPGRYEGPNLYSWYLCAAGMILPSIYEPFGAVVNEALTFGVKVLCSQMAGSASSITAENGFVFNPLDPKDTISKIQLFSSKITKVQTPKVSSRYPFITYNNQELLKEWEKVIRL